MKDINITEVSSCKTCPYMQREKTNFKDTVYSYLRIEIFLAEFEILFLFICFCWLSFTPVRIANDDNNLKKKNQIKMTTEELENTLLQV